MPRKLKQTKSAIAARRRYRARKRATGSGIGSAAVRSLRRVRGAQSSAKGKARAMLSKMKDSKTKRWLASKLR